MGVDEVTCADQPPGRQPLVLLPSLCFGAPFSLQPDGKQVFITPAGKLVCPHGELSSTTKVDWVRAAGGEKKKKPGYVASRKGAELRIDTRQAGLQHVSIGYLQTYSSSAMVQIECEAPCSCTAEELRAHTSSRTSTTAMSPKLRAVAPAGTTCTLRLRMLTDQQPFKLIAIHVEDPTGAAEDV